MDEINIKNLFKILLNHKYKLVSASLIFGIVVLSVSFLLNEKYTSKMILKVEHSGDELSSILGSQYGDLASLAGVSIGGGSEDLTAYAVALLQSNSFAERLMSTDGVKVNLMAARKYNFENQEIIIDASIYDESNNEWVRNPPYKRSIIPSTLEIYEEVLKDDLTVSLDRRSGFIEVTFTHISPVFARDFLNLILKQANELKRKNDYEEASKALYFLEENLKTTNQKELRDSLTKLIESQLQTLMLVDIREDYLLSAIEQPYLPEEEIFPPKALLTFMGLFLGFISMFMYLIILGRK